MKVGDIFYAVMQKDNNPFEKPRITKFIVEIFDTAHSYPIVSTKTDKWGRHYVFRESQIHLTYEDALIEKKKIIEKIEKWEQEKREQDRLYFEEQERKEKQRQIDHDKQVRKEVVQEIRELIKAKKGIMIGRYNYQTAQNDEVEIVSIEEVNNILENIEK